MTVENTYLKALERWFEQLTPQFPKPIAQLKQAAMAQAKAMGLPDFNDEMWRQTQLLDILSRPYSLNYMPADTAEKAVHTVEIEEKDTRIYYLSNGAFEQENKGLKTYDNGVIIGSMRKAILQYPDLFAKYFNKAKSKQDGFFKHLNTALFTDGLFVYVPKNVSVKQTVQLTHALGYQKNGAEFVRNLVVLEEGAELSMTYAEHSFGDKCSFSNAVNEFFIAANAHFKLYQVQNVNENAYIYHRDYFMQSANSSLKTHKVMFNGGWLRNEVYNALLEPGAHSDIQGLYTCDKGQQMENYVLVDHLAPHCESNELFKGILDDFSKAVFNGYIIVQPDAQKTLAYQSNNNIVLTDKAKMFSKPFLEIYADDVKCSHGSTLGQLDEKALFYMQQRGIKVENARSLLLYAFAAEVIDGIHIEHLRIALEDMIKRRLRGELSSCNDCILPCSKSVDFLDIEL